MNKGNHGKILLVDDDATVLKSTANLLKSYNYNVFPTSHVDDALNLFRSNDFDVVITDIVMPDITGIELLQKVHDIDPQVPVILMTAFADIDKMIDAIKMGAFDFIIKPINIELFIHSIEKASKYKKMLLMEEEYKHLLEEFNQEIETLVSERTMGLMALTVADKIRNPAAVIGLTCKRILKEDISEELSLRIKNIISEADKLDSIVTDFETLLKNKKYIFRHEYIDGHLENVISVNMDHATSKGLQIVFKPFAPPLKANIQKNLFQIAISHIIKNAIEATPEGGKITIKTGEEDLHVVITIHDTGPGIEEDLLNKIFDPLFSTKDQRFGMGLSLVKQIITEHMGNIYVASGPSEGTTFTIKLPFRWSES